jgi:hypothetical protein
MTDDDESSIDGMDHDGPTYEYEQLMELSDNLDTDIQELGISTTVIKEDTVMAFAMSFKPRNIGDMDLKI